MEPFGLYVEIEPALQCPDVFLTVTRYAAEPEPYRDLLHFPQEQALLGLLSSRFVKLELTSGIFPRLTNIGLHQERLFFAFSLGRVSVALTPRRLSRPVTPMFWQQLEDGLSELHRQGVTYGHLREDTVAMTDARTPFLFDITGLRSVKKQPPDVDFAAARALRQRWA